MKLWQVRKHWDALAKDDPLWAVLTSSDKQGHRWSLEEFLATGAAEVDRDLAEVRAKAGDFARGSALDFGCGAGRLTQALGAHFDRVTGVDISGQMVALARQHNARPAVSFVQNTRPDLRIFGDGSFDLVYTRITLQHIAPRYTRRYLREFARVLAPGGLLSVQIPERVPAGDPPDRLRFSPWPPTMVMRLRRYVRYHYPGWFPDTPKMQMYALARAEVVARLEDAKLEVLAVDERPHGDVVNLVYLARKAASPLGAGA